MKALKNIITCTLAVALFTGMATAQRMSFDDYSLISGPNLEAGASYRFTNVTSDLDAVVTINGLTNTTLKDIDTPSENGIANANWTPTFVGTGDAGSLHYADFSILFYANGTDELSAPSQFITAILGNDLAAQKSSGFSMEFAQIEGVSEAVDTAYIQGEDSTLPENNAAKRLARWKFNSKAGYNIRYGWQGDNSERNFNAVMQNISGSDKSLSTTSNKTPQNLTLASSPTTIPEPSSILLLTLSLFPLALRRNRS